MMCTHSLSLGVSVSGLQLTLVKNVCKNINTKQYKIVVGFMYFYTTFCSITIKPNVIHTRYSTFLIISDSTQNQLRYF